MIAKARNIPCDHVTIVRSLARNFVGPTLIDWNKSLPLANEKIPPQNTWHWTHQSFEVLQRRKDQRLS